MGSGPADSTLLVLAKDAIFTSGAVLWVRDLWLVRFFFGSSGSLDLCGWAPLLGRVPNPGSESLGSDRWLGHAAHGLQQVELGAVEPGQGLTHGLLGLGVGADRL